MISAYHDILIKIDRPFDFEGKKNLGNLPVAQAEEPVSPRWVVATSAWMMGMSTGQEFPPDGK